MLSVTLSVGSTTVTTAELFVLVCVPPHVNFARLLKFVPAWFVNTSSTTA